MCVGHLLPHLGPQLHGAEHHHHRLQAAVGLRPVQHEGRSGDRQVQHVRVRQVWAARRRDAPRPSAATWHQRLRVEC